MFRHHFIHHDIEFQADFYGDLPCRVDSVAVFNKSTSQHIGTARFDHKKSEAEIEYGDGHSEPLSYKIHNNRPAAAAITIAKLTQ